MTIAFDLAQRHVQTLGDDNANWQTLIADDLVWELVYDPPSAIQRGYRVARRSCVT